jgi:hypothetical protein
MRSCGKPERNLISNGKLKITQQPVFLVGKVQNKLFSFSDINIRKIERQNYSITSKTCLNLFFFNGDPLPPNEEVRHYNGGKPCFLVWDPSHQLVPEPLLISHNEAKFKGKI